MKCLNVLEDNFQGTIRRSQCIFKCNSKKNWKAIWYILKCAKKSNEKIHVESVRVYLEITKVSVDKFWGKIHS